MTINISRDPLEGPYTFTVYKGDISVVVHCSSHDPLEGPHTLTIYKGDVSVVVHCSKPRTECMNCQFRIDALVNKECQRELPVQARNMPKV